MESLPERTEPLYETERTRVSRLVFPTGTVIRKEPLGPDAPRRLRHEVEILERLSGLDGVAQLAPEPPPCPGSILLVDVGGAALSERATPLDPAQLADLGLALARAVAGMHRRGVLHRDVNPANIVVNARGDALNLIDFTLATTVAAVQPEFAHHNAAVGTVPYLAPEQTGRTGRPVDQRADLYAVGATLYELATGAPPFGTGDPLRILHDHLARTPASPSAVSPAVPADLSKIIMHLLEKEPDDRYQSADDLVRDLLRLRRGDPVHPGDQDSFTRPLAPTRLVGREREIDELGTAFTDAMAGRVSGILINGAPGVGKTSLVDELRPIVAGQDGWSVAGKFDQYRRDLEYDGVRQGFRALGRLLLAEPEDSLVEVRERMSRGLGLNARLATALVPELSALLKVPPEPGDPLTAQARAQRTAVEILRAVATPARPLVFFVDDLQWAARTPLGFVDLVQCDRRPASPGLRRQVAGRMAGRASGRRPVNFRHLLRLVEAERAWARGDFQEAAYTFDLAQQKCSTRIRPWHRALILEHTARFYLAHGMDEAGHALLASARRQYLDWGATAKVGQLDWAYPTLRAEPARMPPTAHPSATPAGRRSTLTAGTVDLLGIVAASRALSSETSIEGLRTRVVGILSEMTGATGVHLLLDDQEEHDWLVTTDTDAVPLQEADRRRLAPASVIRYAERTREPVLVADATRDDRFNRDAYLRGLGRCSLLAVPVTIRGEPRAMLLLENRMIRGAFSAERLDGIMLIAGQLAVSLDNALVYTSLERKVTERTRQLATANRRLEQLSVTDPLTGLANRRRLEEVLEAEWRRARQQANFIALAMVDIDHFKLYNDHFGHAAGDRCLQRVAACLAENIGDTHLVARYGGEEFAVVIPGADTDAATHLADRLCSAVRDLAEPHPLNHDGIVTASIGVAAVVPSPDEPVAELAELADVALYRAKRGGRNRVKAMLPRCGPRQQRSGGPGTVPLRAPGTR